MPIATPCDREKNRASAAVLVASTDAAIRDSIVELACSAELEARSFESLDDWMAHAQCNPDACLVLDAGDGRFAAGDHAEALAALCASRPVLLLVDRGDVPGAVRAMRCGAAEVFEKPCRNARLLQSIQRIAAPASSAVPRSPKEGAK